jgi:predicted RNA-binding protein with TRAM domain
VQGFVVFVPGVNVGDEVKIRIKELRQRFAIAEVVTE